MELKASVKNAIGTPRKVRLVIDLVRDKPVTEALNILSFTPRRAAGVVKKLVESAVTNASHNFNLSADNLYIKRIEAQEGMVIKRWMPRAHGHANKILKRRSHIIVWLDEIKQSEGVKEGRKSKMKTFSYEEVKQALKEAEKASKMIQKKGESKTKAGSRKGEKVSQKETESRPEGEPRSMTGDPRQWTGRPNFTRLGDKFKGLIHRTTKKG